ncbi:hypothetical protein Xkoz_03784 [Xenorhabdus kozodoii]|uniref:Uncharacterized protein n=1 Tax=Xenorhabdus kozodoii TaxID=351676 RepID=A0A2D0KX45_9GAMM|nr:hypothetical protein Xkoz_03784 [Xenorhabdus kozodoii]
MNMLVTPHDMNEPLCLIRAVVDVECGFNKHVVNVCHLAVLIGHFLPPALLIFVRQSRRRLYKAAELQK